MFIFQGQGANSVNCRQIKRSFREQAERQHHKSLSLHCGLDFYQGALVLLLVSQTPLRQQALCGIHPCDCTTFCEEKVDTYTTVNVTDTVISIPVNYEVRRDNWFPSAASPCALPICFCWWQQPGEMGDDKPNASSACASSTCRWLGVHPGTDGLNPWKVPLFLHFADCFWFKLMDADWCWCWCWGCDPYSVTPVTDDLKMLLFRQAGEASCQPTPTIVPVEVVLICFMIRF